MVERYLRLLGTGATPAELAASFSEDVDWYIAGHVEAVPWLGRRHGRAGVADFFRQFREGVRQVRVHLEEPLVNGDRAVVLGSFDSLLTASGRVVSSEGAVVMTVRDGLIVHYRVLEDSYAVAQTIGDSSAASGSPARDT
ncbi:hypothetical protein AKJ09_06844 [Labilithrix luteola]|uniref:SnoaL-like domain-containing protein n=1 Tax=Labilithrix luteola TaxID=1391654 RepID=A0A0K1Q2Z0_9BACT|nr:hypothetical protein AKJ09_06844 [Labilithrix luteola]